jgi:hypothetical protein
MKSSCHGIYKTYLIPPSIVVVTVAFLTILSATFFTPRNCRASSAGKEFTTSVIYGTLAGTLVGAATLAFTTNPGDNLNNVARGASYGLYAGILLGLYVVYGVPDAPPKESQRPGDENYMLPGEGGRPGEGGGGGGQDGLGDGYAPPNSALPPSPNQPLARTAEIAPFFAPVAASAGVPSHFVAGAAFRLTL